MNFTLTAGIVRWSMRSSKIAVKESYFERYGVRLDNENRHT